MNAEQHAVGSTWLRFAMWALCFSPLFNLAYPPPPDMAVRVVRVVAMLIAVVVMLGIVQPWTVRRGRSLL